MSGLELRFNGGQVTLSSKSDHLHCAERRSALAMTAVRTKYEFQRHVKPFCHERAPTFT